MKDYIALSELLGDVRDTLDKEYGAYQYRIIAEVTDVKIYYNRQYAFLTLVEKQNGEVVSSVGAVVWRDNFHILREFEKNTGAKFDQNLELVLEVEIQFHVRYGLRISILKIDETFTLGKLEQDRQNTLLRLIKENKEWVWLRDTEYRSANHLKKLPMVMQRIALISAPGSDGRRDFLHELHNNEYGIDYSIAELPAQVQGEAAVGQIASRLERLQNTKDAVDAIAIVRGGGSSTDFSAFDSYSVALAVAKSHYPVFTGIGHERNVSITDLLAFAAEKTPTKCAASLTQHNLVYLAFMQTAATNIKSHSLNKIDQFQKQVLQYRENLRKSAVWRISKDRQWMENSAGRIQSADPGNILLRGFSLVYKNGKHIGLSKKLQSGDAVEIRFADDTLKAKIE